MCQDVLGLSSFICSCVCCVVSFIATVVVTLLCEKTVLVASSFGTQLSTEVSTSSCVVLGCVLQLWDSKLPHLLLRGVRATHHPRERHWDDVVPTGIVWVVTVWLAWFYSTLF